MSGTEQGLEERLAMEIGEPSFEVRRLIQERKRWFYALEVEKKQEKLFEFEILLKSLVRFSNLSNHPVSNGEPLLTRDFSNELAIVCDGLQRSIILTQNLLPAPESNIIYFQNYVETRLLGDYQRAQLLKRALRQLTPIESLYVLRHSLASYYELCNNLLKLEVKGYNAFYHFMQMLSREIIGNRFFNPFRAAGFAPHYDVIRNAKVSRVVKRLEPRELKRVFSIIILLLFKLLKYISFIPQENASLKELKSSLLIFALIRSESQFLVEVFEKLLPGRLNSIEFPEPSQRELILQLVDSFAFQLRMEMRKIFELELKDLVYGTERRKLQAGVSRSRGLLINIFQQAIVELVKVFEPSIEGKDIFRDFISRLEQSLKLRKDIWLFIRVLDNLERTIHKSFEDGNLSPVIESISSLRNFIYYYQNISFQLVRCYDRDEFQAFFDWLDGFPVEKLDEGEVAKEFIRRIHIFKMFLETTFANVNQRSELKDLPFGSEEGEKLLAQFLV